MNRDLAHIVAHETRLHASEAAAADLAKQRNRAIEAGREESRQLVKTSHIDRRTGDIRYNPTGRLLRDWYFHVYLNTLRERLGYPHVPIDTQQVEDVTALARRLAPGPAGIQALHAVSMLHHTAEDDANHATVEIVQHLHEVAAARAVAEAPDHRFDSDELRVHVTRHWYQRCYLDHIESATRSQQSLAGVTDGEERQVAYVMHTGVPRRLIGRNGVPIVTLHGTLINDVDRQLAASEAGVVPGNLIIKPISGEMKRLQELVRSNWRNLRPGERRAWSLQAGVPDPGPAPHWQQFSKTDQTKIIRYYLDANRGDIIGQPFDRSTIRTDPARAARRMFNHNQPLVSKPEHVSAAGSASSTTERSPAAEGNLLRPRLMP